MKTKKILIIGASSGIGKATAILLSKKGYHLVLISRNEQKLKEVIAECEGNHHVYEVIDITETEKFETYITKQVSDSNIPFDGLVYSAGIEGTLPLKFLKKDFLEQIISVNTISAVLVSKILLKKKHFL